MKYDLKVRVYNESPSFGKGVVLLLEGIQKYGSLSAAYKSLHMSSSKAWKILNKAQSDLGISLVEGHSGGATGGQTILTKQGEDMLKRYQDMMKEIEKNTYDSFLKYFGDL